MRGMILIFLTTFFVFSFTGVLFADDNGFQKPSLGDILGDVLVIRPLGFIEIAVNSFLFVISLPVTIPLKETRYAEEWLIKEPCEFYFHRRLGEPLGKM